MYVLLDLVRSSRCKRLSSKLYIYLHTSSIMQTVYNYPFCSYLDCLPCLEERLVRIGHIFQRDPVELALVDVRYSIILAAL